MIKTLDNQPEVAEILHRGKPLPEKVLDRITEASIELSTDQASEIIFKIDDPAFEILSSGVLDLRTPINYRGLNLYVAVIETDEGGGLGGLTITCRPIAIKKLRDLQGDYVMRQSTPADYIAKECEKAEVAKSPITQRTDKKKKISRDTSKSSGVATDPTDATTIPSAWTTMQRLADEDGCLIYEVGGRVIYGKPTWLVKNLPLTRVHWYSDDGKEPMAIPLIRHSEDSRDIEVDIELPLGRSGNVLPGSGLALDGFPRYSDTYFITSVSYPLAGDGTVSVSATTVRNPEKQKVTEVTNTPTTTVTSSNDVKQIAIDMLPKYGWGDDQFPPLEQLWEHESGWNYKADNPTSDAYGIPQALPGSKMASAGKDWRTNPATQIKWGLGYIKGRYGSPAAAWRFWQSHNWY